MAAKKKSGTKKASQAKAPAQTKKASPPAPVKKAPDFSAVGVSGLEHNAGRIVGSYLPALADGQRRAETFTEMADDAVVGGMLFAIEQIVRKAPVSLTPADDSGERGQEVADFVDECLKDMFYTWDDSLSSILSMLTYGYDLEEVVFKRRQGRVAGNKELSSKFSDGRVGWAKWETRGQSSITEWKYDPNGGSFPVAAIQQDPNGGQDITLPLDRCLHFRPKSNRANPEGHSIIQSAYKNWWIRSRLEIIESIGIERDLAGFPVMKVPAEIMDTGSDGYQLYLELQKMVAEIKRDAREGVIIPSDVDPETKAALFELELLTSGGRRQFDISGTVNRHDHRILMSVLADFLMLGSMQVGSYALSSDKTEIFAVAISAWLESIAATINRTAIPDLMDVNGISEELAPTLSFGDIESIDLEKLATFLDTLHKAGATLFPDEDLRADLLNRAGLDFSDEAPEAPKPPPMLPPQMVPPGPAGPEPGEATPEEEVDALAKLHQLVQKGRIGKSTAGRMASTLGMGMGLTQEQREELFGA